MSGAKPVAIVLGAFVVTAIALAPQVVRPEPAAKSYERVKVTPAPVFQDASFAAFRQNLAAIAGARVFGTFARNVVPQGFFWVRDSGAFDPKKTGVENLAAAIDLRDGSGGGWQMLADFAAEPTATEIPEAPGVMCAPGRPVFSQDDFDRLVDATRSTAADWVFARSDGVDLRASPRSSGAAVEKLDGSFLRVLGFDTARVNADPLRTSWAHVAAPSGKIGYAAPATLVSPTAPQLCYVKDIAGRWYIAGFIGGGS